MGDPSTATWTTVNDLIGPEDAFARTEVDLSAFASETNVYIAFHYVGNFAAEWYVDNVFLSEPLAPQVASACPVSLMPADGSTVDPDPVNGVLLTWAPATSAVSDPAYPTGYLVDLGSQNPPTDIVNFNAQGANAVLTGPVDYNTTYFYTVRSLNAAGGPESCPVVSFTTGDAPAPPPNDNIADAIVIESDGTVTGSNVLATAEDPEPDPSCTSGGNVTSVYWSFTAGDAGLVTIDASNSTFDTVLTLHEADGTEIACDDDGGAGTTSLLSDVAVTPGDTYIIRFAGFGATTVGDISFDISGIGGGGGEQVSLPATFDDPNVDYELTDFGGAMSMITVDPEDETNNVVETLRPAPPAGECFAGTTVADATGFVEPIPFAPGETQMSVRVWSPEVGVRILFKVEQVGNPGINVETFSFTTVAEAWETIVFDFANPMPNTNPINFENVYNKASIFFDFQCNLDPTATLPATFYWDDVAFGGDTGGPVTIAEARTAGVGATVTVTGTVTRAMGAFTYFQDETGGLTIRQTSGDFFDDVTDGTISGGTEITVTGTISMFNGLLQINGGDLMSYSVGATGDLPAPQMIALDELIANGEDYEAELVQVSDLTTDGMGMFTAATSYDVGDPTTPLADNNILRIPNAADSDIDGTPIPVAEFTFTGVVGQFDGSEPQDEGYQLLAIAEGDIEAQGAGGLIEFDPNPLVAMLATGETGTETVTVINNSDQEVAYDFSQYSDTPPPARAEATSGQPTLELAKGEADPRGYVQRFGAGGPDAFGYEWIDSNEPGGPAFETIDISGTGTEIVGADLNSTNCSAETGNVFDGGFAELDLPFDFSFYGADYGSVSVNVNGWLTFMQPTDGHQLLHERPHAVDRRPQRGHHRAALG